jgi:hypothetical protein
VAAEPAHLEGPRPEHSVVTERYRSSSANSERHPKAGRENSECAGIAVWFLNSYTRGERIDPAKRRSRQLEQTRPITRWFVGITTDDPNFLRACQPK